jgi:hypothetical protein
VRGTCVGVLAQAMPCLARRVFVAGRDESGDGGGTSCWGEAELLSLQAAFVVPAGMPDLLGVALLWSLAESLGGIYWVLGVAFVVAAGYWVASHWLAVLDVISHARWGSRWARLAGCRLTGHSVSSLAESLAVILLDAAGCRWMPSH